MIQVRIAWTKEDERVSKMLEEIEEELVEEDEENWWLV